MHRQPRASIVCLSLLAALGACHKDEPATAAPAPSKTAEVSAPVDASAQGAATPAPVKHEETKEVASAPEAAPAANAAAEAAKPASSEGASEAAPAKTEEKPAEGAQEPSAEAKKPAEGATEASAEAKKPAKKKASDKAAAGDKTAEAPKETKPKFTELGVSVTKTGSGVAATTGKRVVIHYKATVADAEKPFDSTFASNRPLEVDLGIGAKLKVIEGLRRGLEGLTPGSEARLQIPASLAWGEKGDPAAGVPANADVVFEVQVLDVQ